MQYLKTLISGCIMLLAACGDAEERDCAVGQDTQNGYYTLHLAEHGGDCGRVWETVDTIIKWIGLFPATKTALMWCLVLCGFRR
jgi:hypothetical protein